MTFLVTSLHTPQLQIAFYLTVCFALGFTVAFVIGFRERRRLEKNDKGDTGPIWPATEAELNAFRTLPITGDVYPRDRKETGSGRGELIPC